MPGQSVVNDAFWDSRIAIVRNNTLPSMYKLLKETGRWDLLDLKILEGSKPHQFWDSDNAKFLEAVCYSLRYMDQDDPLRPTFLLWIEKLEKMIIKAQQPDGYINSYYTIVQPELKLKNITERHELYCAGHLLEAAIAHHQVTGKDNLLDALCRYLDLICNLFGPEEGKLHGYPGHQEIEIAIARLLEFRWEDRYFELLNYFVEQRGYKDGEFFDEQAYARGVDPYRYILGEQSGDPAWPRPRFYEYYQAETQIRDTHEVKGHSVRQFYYLTAVQKLAMIKDDDSLREAVKVLWNNAVKTKMYAHGGIGAIGDWEGFGDEYDLRWDGYSETCASIALIFCAQAILQDRLDSGVAYVMERALYNNVLGGVSLDGKAYYYDQPVSGSKGVKRQDWFECSCCPPNVARLFNNLQDYVVYEVDDKLAVNLFIAGDYYVGDSKVSISTTYPIEGFLQLEVTSQRDLQLAIRAPREKFEILNDGYKFENGYIVFPKNAWAGEKITIKFEQSVKIIKPDPRVEANSGCYAVEYGPFVYAIQNSGLHSKVPLEDLSISETQHFDKRLVEAGGSQFWQLSTSISGVDCDFVPYYVTGNEHPGEDFRIWIKQNQTTSYNPILGALYVAAGVLYLGFSHYTQSW